jgi:tocopherol O-methyltransferase
MFNKEDIAAYYNTTQNHYEKWWDLNNNLSLHYGIWSKGINSFSESLQNTNKVMMELANIKAGEKVLDAGCGVGGAAMYLAKNKKAAVTGITLSEKQVATATSKSKEKGLSGIAQFQLMDYTNTSFKDNSFDAVWACESASSAPNKADFIKEAYRVLKKGGRLILTDFFITTEFQEDKNDWIKKWGETWSIENFSSNDSFSNTLTQQGFTIKDNIDYTEQIRKSAKRMYHAALAGAIPSEIYNLLHPNVSRFAKRHYLCGYFQYKALQEHLWKYQMFLAIKV